jgi:tRNA-dihydrouridine synthase 3
MCRLLIGFFFDISGLLSSVKDPPSDLLEMSKGEGTTNVEDTPVAKKLKLDEGAIPDGRIKGIAPIRAEYLISKEPVASEDDDEAEGSGLIDRGTESANMANGGRKAKRRGQNKNRKFVQPRDTVKFCEQLKDGSGVCSFGETCRYEHDATKYISSKPDDLPGVCPVFSAIGYCPSGVKCRWLFSHYKGNELLFDQEKRELVAKTNFEVNRVSPKIQHEMQRKKFEFSKSTHVISLIDSQVKRHGDNKQDDDTNMKEETNAGQDTDTKEDSDVRDEAASYVESPLLASEKKKLYYNRAKILSPLTTVGNLPYRRLMKTLGADITFSEMALSLPLIQGAKSEWALARAHSSERGGFGVQLAASKYWQAIKAAEAVRRLAPDTSEINLNCGCPIDLLYRQGAGSALLDNPARLLRMVHGMNIVSDEIPVTVKLRTGTRDGHPTAKNLIDRIIDQGEAAAITLHGRSRAQRYTRMADWDYIKQIADFVKTKRAEVEDVGDGRHVKPWIVGNGDVYSWEDWYYAVDTVGVDSAMVARGALIKPWIFEEIESRQYIDKSATERLELIKQYANYGLEHWGSDEYGINMTRRYLCEFLSFTHRYIPVGILEYLPPKLNDRPPLWKGRNELETLLASTDYKDWIKVSEMFLGPAHEGFDFTPKHKSNAHE